MTPEEGTPLSAVRAQRAGVRVAMGDVERAAAAAAADRIVPWALSLRERLVGLLAAFDHHIHVTESAGGLLEEVVEAAPRLAKRAEQLRSDHVAIRGLIQKAISELEQPESLKQADVDEIRDGVLDIFRQIGHHRHLGADFVYQGYNVDIEASD